MMSEEHQMKNDVKVYYGRDSIAPRPCFLFFPFSLNILQY